MAITVAGIEGSTSAVNGTSVATGSIALPANQLILACIQSRRASGSPAATPTASSSSFTWTQVVTGTNGVNRRSTIFRALAGAGATEAITFSFGAETQSEFTWSIVSFDGVDTSGTNGSGAIVQAPAITTGTSNTSLITLAGFGSASNMAFGFNTHGSATATSVGSGFVEVHDVTQSEVGQGIQTEYKLNETAVTAGYSTSIDWTALGVEIKAAGASGSTNFLGIL